MKASTTGFVAAVAFAAGALLPIRAGAPVPATAGEAKDIRRLDQKESVTERGRYPKEMVGEGQKSYEGRFLGKTQYTGEDPKLTVALWESGPGVLQTDSYPHDEYVLVLEGKLVVTNASGTTDEFKPGDSFVIPKGWAGTWDMKTKFKKQWAAIPAAGLDLSDEG